MYSDTLIQKIVACFTSLVDFFKYCIDGLQTLFITGDSLSDYGVLTVVVFSVGLATCIVAKLIDYFVRRL